MEWYAKWFGSEYISLYSHRDLEEARRQVSFVLGLIPGTSPLKVLDVGCGFGRHVEMFVENGHSAVGLDLSAELLAHSRKLHSSELQLVRGDMRALPFSNAVFDLLCNFFTGFGYFTGNAEHVALLVDWRRVQPTGGKLFLDYLNRDKVIATLEPESVSENCEQHVTQKRRISTDGTRVEKHISIRDKKTGTIEEFDESVRMFSLSELQQLLVLAGYRTLQTFGGFSREVHSISSDRLLILAEAY